jgi:hypothetical protein
MPGWQVEGVNCPAASVACATAVSPVDDLPLLQPLRANLTLIGIVVPPGELTFTLRYRPLSVQLGLGISGATLLLLAVVTSWRWRRRSIS